MNTLAQFAVEEEIRLSSALKDICDPDIQVDDLIYGGQFASSKDHMDIVLSIQRERTQQRIANALEILIDLIRSH